MLRKLQGFSLIELIMVIVLMGIISVMIGRFLLAAYTTFITSNDISEADWQSYVAAERMTDEIHNIRSPSDITTIQATNFVFTNSNGSSVQFQLSGSSLLLNGQVLASGIQSLSFSYLDQSGVATSTQASVRYILVQFSLQQGKATTTFVALIGARILL